MLRDLEDKIDDLVVGVFKAISRFAGRYAWEIADRTFKLISWTLILGAINAFQKRTGNEYLFVAEIILTLLIVIATLSVTFNAAIQLQDKAIEKWIVGKNAGLLIRILVGVGTMIGILWPLLGIVLPFLSKVFLAVLEALAVAQATP